MTSLARSIHSETFLQPGLCVCHLDNSASAIFIHIMLVSGCDRELNTHFHSAALP